MGSYVAVSDQQSGRRVPQPATRRSIHKKDQLHRQRRQHAVGIYTVEQTSGTHAYGPFEEDLPAYPLTFEFRLDTLIGGVVVYQSSLSIRPASADNEGALTPINVMPGSSSGGGSSSSLPTDCTYLLPDSAVRGELETTPAFFGPNLEDGANINLQAGGSWWIMDARSGFYKLWITCQANPLWVPASTMVPNYNSPWGGAPLPDAGG